MSTTPTPARPDPSPSAADVLARLDGEIASALATYQADRLRRREPTPAPEAPSEIDVDAAVGFAVDVLEAAGEPAAALCLVYVQAFRATSAGRMRDALHALADCGPSPVSFREAARLAAATPYARPTRASAWSPRRALRRGDLVRHLGSGPAMRVEDTGTTPRKGLVALCSWTDRRGAEARDWFPVADLSPAPRPTIEPTGPTPAEAGAEEGGAS
jgi:hypothetical protein